MKQREQDRLRNAAAAVAVVLLHVLAISILLATHVTFIPRPQNAVTTWILLAPVPTQDSLERKQPALEPLSLHLPPVVGTGVASGPSIASLPPPSPPVSLFIAPPATLGPKNPDSRVLSGIGDYLYCDLPNYDELPEAQRERCALKLSNLGEIRPFADAYVDNKVKPFSLFGARGSFAITPPTQRTYDLLQSSIGCFWEGGLCRPLQPDKFGLDPDDPKRLTAAAHFELTKGLSLDVGGQAYMQNYLGGARLAYAAGVVLTYRW